MDEAHPTVVIICASSTNGHLNFRNYRFHKLASEAEKCIASAIIVANTGYTGNAGC